MQNIEVKYIRQVFDRIFDFANEIHYTLTKQDTSQYEMSDGKYQCFDKSIGSGGFGDYANNYQLSEMNTPRL